MARAGGGSKPRALSGHTEPTELPRRAGMTALCDLEGGRWSPTRRRNSNDRPCESLRELRPRTEEFGEKGEKKASSSPSGDKPALLVSSSHSRQRQKSVFVVYPLREEIRSGNRSRLAAILVGKAKLNLAGELLAIDCSPSPVLLRFARNLQNTHKNFHPGQTHAVSQIPTAASPRPESGQSCSRDPAETTCWRSEKVGKPAGRDAGTQAQAASSQLAAKHHLH